ncbi:hypothetical protein GCM10023186_10320 [Hymenobacter koreensis]|uniref:Uncharacterized protein n=1 Tax=Hymenobacter koreensis TaxID=1084523 RepID=A0ABP8IW05_9BACT
MADMPAVAARINHHGVAGNQRNAVGIAKELFASTFKAELYEVEFLKIDGQVEVLQPVEYIQAVTAS